MLILASKSPQRKKILRDMGLKFKIKPSHIKETSGGLKRPYAIAKYIALQKALEVSQQHPYDWIIGCDTFVILADGSLSVKPKSRADAKRTINKYRNSHCDVYSGLALVNKSLKKQFIGYEKTRLHFAYFTDTDTEEYLNSDEWKNRSGSMTIEGRGGEWVKKIDGCYWNVVGLPVELLKKFLKQID